MPRGLVLWVVLLVACSEADPGVDASTPPGAGMSAAGASGGGGGASSAGQAAGCPPAMLSCEGACVDVESDPDHCGVCARACASDETCVVGTCAPRCGDPSAPDACEDECTDVKSDAKNCGECGLACPATAVCNDANCECPDDGTLCGDACVDLQVDEAHCGECEAACPRERACVEAACVRATIHHLLITGQSLSVGATSTVVSTEQPYDNIMFNTGVRAGGTGLTSFAPLVETLVAGEGETIASGTANLLHELATEEGFDLRVLASAHGVSGQPYTVLAKGTAAYANGMAQVAAGTMLSLGTKEIHEVRAVAAIHGESDHIAGNLMYDQNLLQWQADYETDVQVATGQTTAVPLFFCQMSSFTNYGQATSAIPGLQLAAARARPERVFVVAPKYFLPYTDGVHLTGDGERWLGEYYAKAMARVLVDGKPWLPVSPREVTRDGAKITLSFHVPVPPLVFDETLVTNPGTYGFEYTDTSGAPPTIQSVELIDDTTVRVTLAKEPTGDAKRIRYAYTGIANQPAGPMTGARGNLRDSDATPSLHGYSLFNWAVHFDEPVP